MAGERKRDREIVKIEPGRPAELERLRDTVSEYIRSSESKNTIKARNADWKVFAEWCTETGVRSALPVEPDILAAFLADQSKKDKAVATVIRYARSIHALHKIANHPSPTHHEAVRLVLRGIRRQRGVEQERKDAMTAEVLASALVAYESAYGGSKLGLLRDRLVVLLGLSTAMRCSELCDLRVEDIHRVDQGLVLQLRRSKTDQEGAGRPVAVQQLEESDSYFCPVRALDMWLEVSGTKYGYVLSGLKRNGERRGTRLSETVVWSIVKRVAAAGGFDSSRFGAHSLRSGFVTTARQQGIDWAAIMEQTGHKRLETVKLYTRYTPDVFVSTRVGDVFKNAFAKRKKR